MSILNKRLDLGSKAAVAALPALVVASSVAWSPASASAATLTYDADASSANGATDGTGVWNTTAANWFDGANDVVWPNTTGDIAVFGAVTTGTGGTVTVGAVNVGTIQFNQQTTTGYTLTGGTITLGTGITINSAGTPPNTTINSIIAGTNGLVFTGAGTSTTSLGGANTYSGITTLSATGRLGFNNVSAFGASSGATASTLGTDYTQVTSGGAISSAFSGATSEAFLLNGNGGGSTTGALRIGSGNPIYNSLVRIGSASQIFSNGGVDTFNGNVDVQTFGLSINTYGGGPCDYQRYHSSQHEQLHLQWCDHGYDR